VPGQKASARRERAAAQRASKSGALFFDGGTSSLSASSICRHKEHFIAVLYRFKH